jgi:protein CpxP
MDTMTIFKNVKASGLRVAMVGLCTVTLAAPMALRAQDQGAPPPPQSDGTQQGGRPNMEQMRERQIEHMTKMLSLTPDQVTQVRAIDADSMSKMAALRQDTSTPREQKRDKMMQIRSDSQAKVRMILTDEQKPKYDAMLAKEKERMEQRRQGGGAPSDQPAPPPQ